MSNIYENLSKKYESRAEQIRQEIYFRFSEFRKYLDDLPPDILDPKDSNYHFYKCRHGFFTAVRNDINKLIMAKVVKDLLLVEEGNRFIEFVKSDSFSQRRTIESDIEYVNSILDKFIEALQP